FLAWREKRQQRRVAPARQRCRKIRRSRSRPRRQKLPRYLRPRPLPRRSHGLHSHKGSLLPRLHRSPPQTMIHPHPPAIRSGGSLYPFFFLFRLSLFRLSLFRLFLLLVLCALHLFALRVNFCLFLFLFLFLC